MFKKGVEIDVPYAVVSLKVFFRITFRNQDIESVYRSARDTKLEKGMSKDVKIVSKESTLASAVDTMVTNHLRRRKTHWDNYSKRLKASFSVIK